MQIYWSKPHCARRDTVERFSFARLHSAATRFARCHLAIMLTVALFHFTAREKNKRYYEDKHSENELSTKHSKHKQ